VQVEATLVVRMAMRLNYAAFIMQQCREAEHQQQEQEPQQHTKSNKNNN